MTDRRGEPVLHDVEAVVLVGGKGTRLRPLTLSAPKPMLPTAGVPFLAHLLSRIRAAGVRRVVLGTSYLAETFSEAFGDGAALGLEIEYVVEDQPLGTGGGIRNVAKHLSTEHVLVFNGDVLCGTDLGAVVDTHRRTEADVTLHLVRVQDPRAYGCVPTDDHGRVLEFLEKTEDPPTDQINAGCYVFRRSVIESIPEGRPVSVERETFPGLLAAGSRVSGHVDNAYWRAPRPTSSTARPTWSAAWPHPRRCPVRRASPWCWKALRWPRARWCSAAPPSGAGCGSAPARASRARCCSTARWSARARSWSTP
jgi:mannose-1-phosphate guanylyltransferase